jgi:hypothetical protein
MDRAKGRRNKMLLPALGNGRLPRKQRTQILKANCVRKGREQREPNGE